MELVELEGGVLAGDGAVLRLDEGVDGLDGLLDPGLHPLDVLVVHLRNRSVALTVERPKDELQELLDLCAAPSQRRAPSLRRIVETYVALHPVEPATVTVRQIRFRAFPLRHSVRLDLHAPAAVAAPTVQDHSVSVW